MSREWSQRLRASTIPLATASIPVAAAVQADSSDFGLRPTRFLAVLSQSDFFDTVIAEN